MGMATGGAVGCRAVSAGGGTSSHDTGSGFVVFTFPTGLAAWPAEGIYLVTLNFPIATGQARRDGPRFCRRGGMRMGIVMWCAR